MLHPCAESTSIQECFSTGTVWVKSCKVYLITEGHFKQTRNGMIRGQSIENGKPKKKTPRRYQGALLFSAIAALSLSNSFIIKITACFCDSSRAVISTVKRSLTPSK